MDNEPRIHYMSKGDLPSNSALVVIVLRPFPYASEYHPVIIGCYNDRSGWEKVDHVDHGRKRVPLAEFEEVMAWYPLPLDFTY